MKKIEIVKNNCKYQTHYGVPSGSITYAKGGAYKPLYDVNEVGTQLMKIGSQYFINYHFDNSFLDGVSIEVDNSPLTKNDKLLFLPNTNFPVRKLKSLSKGNPISGISTVKKVQNATRIVGYVDKGFTEDELKKYFKVEELSNYMYWYCQSYLYLDINHGGKNYNVMGTGRYFASFGAVTGMMYADKDTILKNHDYTKCINYLLSTNKITSKLPSVGGLDSITARVFMPIDVVSTADYRTRDSVCNLITDKLFDVIDAGYKFTDISTLYSQIGDSVMDADEYINISKSLETADELTFKMITESLTTYNLDESMFYMCMLVRNHLEVGKSQWLNTNVKSLMNICTAACGASKGRLRNLKPMEILEKLSKKGYVSKVPLSFFVQLDDLEEEVKSRLKYIKSDVYNFDFDIKIKVAVRDELKEHVYEDVKLSDISITI